MIISTENIPYEEPKDFVKLSYGNYRVKITGNGNMTSNGSLPVYFEILDGENKGKVTQEFLNLTLTTNKPKVNAFTLKFFDVIASVPKGTYTKMYHAAVNSGKNQLDIDFVEEDANGNLKLTNKVIGNIINLKISGGFNERSYEKAATELQILGQSVPDKETIDNFGNKRFYSRFVNFNFAEPVKIETPTPPVNDNDIPSNPFTDEVEKVIITPPEK
ncbi:MAG: hypothetical protein LBT99_03750 [Bifidobacteriaceae bacterium]|jgi:hypothetical protein|nr:hypothetical protein [Bifidobacteriaceae bacterium]